MNKVLVAMSGGVDSSAAALILKNQGCDLTGVTLKMFDKADLGLEKDSRCCSLKDTEDARSVAHRLGFPFYVFNFCEPFRKNVLDVFVSEYEKGRTPNPCVYCNRSVKLGRLFEKAKSLGFDHIATGHYARVAFDEEKGRWLLLRGKDEGKDQSYMLYTLTQEQLAHILFPLGSMSKDEIRQMAQEAGLVNAQKPDSQDICFVPEGNYADFIARYSGKKSSPGPFMHINGEKLGTHKGQIRYTIGQRKGLGIAYQYPLYVIKKDAARNIVWLGPEEALYEESFTVSSCNFIAMEDPAMPFECTVKTRYRQKDLPAVVEPLGEGRVKVRFRQPQKKATPGQAAVFYDGDVVIGGGIID